MNKLFYRLVIFVLIFSIGSGVFFSYKDFVCKEYYNFDYVEDSYNNVAVNDSEWIDQVEIKKPGYYYFKIMPSELSLDNQTHHILEMLDSEKNSIVKLEDWLYVEIKTRVGLPDDGIFPRNNANPYDHEWSKKIAKKLVKIERAQTYDLKYISYKDKNNLESEDVKIFIYRVLNPYILGIITLILGFLGMVFIPKFLKLEKINNLLKRKK